MRASKPPAPRSTMRSTSLRQAACRRHALYAGLDARHAQSTNGFDDAAPAEQERVGHESAAAPDRRRSRRSRRARRNGDRAPDIPPPARRQRPCRRPPSWRRRRTSVIRPPLGFDADIPALRTGLAEIELGRDRQARGIGSSSSSAAIGASQLAGKPSSAAVTNTGFGRMRVRIDSALMPGSNTPSPPGSQIQSWPGCQTRTSSFQLMCTDLIRRAGQPLRAPARPRAQSASARSQTACASRPRATAINGVDLG